MNRFTSLVVVVFILFTLITSDDVALADDVTEINWTPIDSGIVQNIQNISDIRIDPASCTVIGENKNVPNTLFTIFPSDDGSVTVETSPANLFTAKTEGDVNYLVFDWMRDVASTATSGGVRIGIPPDQLKRLWVYEGNTVQVLDGFTSINELLTLGTNSTIHALMTSSISTRFELKNEGGQMYIGTNVNVSAGWVYKGGSTWVKTPSFNRILISDEGSKLYIKGDVDFTDSEKGDLAIGAQLKVTGAITGTINSYDATFINAPSCDNVIINADGGCNEGPQDVDFDVGNLSQNSQILSGYRCGEVSSSFSLFVYGYYIVITIVIAAATSILIS